MCKTYAFSHCLPVSLVSLSGFYKQSRWFSRVIQRLKTRHRSFERVTETESSCIFSRSSNMCCDPHWREANLGPMTLGLKKSSVRASVWEFGPIVQKVESAGLGKRVCGRMHRSHIHIGVCVISTLDLWADRPFAFTGLSCKRWAHKSN